MERMTRNGIDYEEKSRSRGLIDDNPVFNTSLRMQSPAPDGHFLRVFGQPNRIGPGRPARRQRLDAAGPDDAQRPLTHEAARVGDLEPMYKLLTGKSAESRRRRSSSPTSKS